MISSIKVHVYKDDWYANADIQIINYIQLHNSNSNTTLFPQNMAYKWNEYSIRLE
jgi:hypothetical protein